MDITEKLKLENTAISIEAMKKIESLRKRAKFWEKECKLERRKNFKIRFKKMIEKKNGNLGVKIINGKYGIELLITKNGWQWQGQNVTYELLELLADAIKDFNDNETKT